MTVREEGVHKTDYDGCDVCCLCRPTCDDHKLVLAARSPVFCAMFDGPLAESGEIEISDIRVDVFSVILR